MGNNRSDTLYTPYHLPWGVNGFVCECVLVIYINYILNQHVHICHATIRFHYHARGRCVYVVGFTLCLPVEIFSAVMELFQGYLL